jgi:hypothetical protein
MVPHPGAQLASRAINMGSEIIDHFDQPPSNTRVPTAPPLTGGRNRYAAKKGVKITTGALIARKANLKSNIARVARGKVQTKARAVGKLFNLEKKLKKRAGNIPLEQLRLNADRAAAEELNLYRRKFGGKGIFR